MILVKANQELKLTFEKLIETMKVPVKWTGIFAVADDYMILQGQVRSLFFHFDSRKVITNIIDIPVKEKEVWDIVNNTTVRNTINMILYAFGKWGTISGLRVDKDYAQLNRLFGGILKEIGVNIEFTKEHFRFFKNGIRITYEDVIQAALEERDKPLAEETETPEEGGGLWHRLIWKAERVTMARVETSIEERIKDRIGNNFYMIGYLCPGCKQKLHMAVYPADNEFRIETEEGGVLLARACACDRCNCFYTPRPGRLLMEGDIYHMPFEDDRKAYEDYLELLGRQSSRCSNGHFNRFADGRRNFRKKEESLEELYEGMEEMSDEEVEDVEARIDEVFFPDASTKKLEKKVRERARTVKKRRRKAREGQGKDIAAKPPVGGSKEDMPLMNGELPKWDETKSFAKKSNNVRSREEHGRQEGIDRGIPPQKKAIRDLSDSSGSVYDMGGREEKQDDGKDKQGSRAETEQAKKYEARLHVIDRLSDRQIGELQKQIETDSSLLPEEKEAFLGRIHKKRQKERAAQYAKKVDSCADKPYAVAKRVEEEIKNEENLPEEEKQRFLEKLAGFLKNQGEKEVHAIIEKMPIGMDRMEHSRFMERLRAYKEVDLSPYEEVLRAGREDAERQEIAKTVKNARKKTRADYAALADKLRGGGYDAGLTEPYLTKIQEKIKKMDEEAIDKILEDSAGMSFEEGKEAYESIAAGEFLPELKVNALKMLEKKLAKIKTDETELLVKKLMSEFEEEGIGDNPRHYFYPARKVLLGQAEREETEVIDFAMASYAAGCGIFEYPVFVVDTSRNGSGKEGMILTPDHLYYSTLLSSYGMEISSIAKVTGSTGLLNKGLYVQQGNGTKTKIPYAVEGKELPAYAKVLDAFIHYLQEKPDSRKVAYLAQEKHEKICCFRCGTVYKGGVICPKCGYKNNG